tara:strand:+ start:1048 stop:1662 length:615 start_codon:yes stop_codon:yes gene_type:complete
MKMFVLRCLACNAGIVASYPLETMKVATQTDQNVSPFAGIEAPIIFSSFTNGLRFQIYSFIKPYSFFWALIISGSVNGILEYPYQTVKLQKQLPRKKLYPGGQRIIFSKELLGTIVHFYLFSLLVNEQTGALQTSFYGGLTAGVGMTLVYPLDTFFVNYKTRDMEVEDSIDEGELWKGYLFNLARTILGYSVTMFIQSKLIGGV